jgi:hypothetical protein
MQAHQFHLYQNLRISEIFDDALRLLSTVSKDELPFTHRDVDRCALQAVKMKIVELTGYLADYTLIDINIGLCIGREEAERRIELWRRILTQPQR